jgi:hypothetical protein
MRRFALTAAVAIAPGFPHAASAATTPDPRPTDLRAGLTGLVSDLGASTPLSGARRAVIHNRKAALVAAAFGDPALGSLTYANVFTPLDCIGRELQRARSASGAGIASRVARALTCQRGFARAVAATDNASPALQRALTLLRTRLGEVATAVKRKRAFGAKAAATRRAAAALVTRFFPRSAVGGVPFPQAYASLECIDVKVESGAIGGAAACARKLLRLLRAATPPVVPVVKEPVTFGSDLTGSPVALRGTYLDDTEFWTEQLTVPVDGRITGFRLKVGANPVDLPLRFSVVRPHPDGQVEVQTTTNPVYPLPGGTPGVVTYSTSVLSFTCCKAKAGDIVTVDNSGTTVRDPYTWFAAKPGSTTFSHTMGGDSQNKGVLWRGVPNAGYEVLLQVTMQPG